MKTITLTDEELATLEQMTDDAYWYRYPDDGGCRDCDIAQNDECDDHAEDREKAHKYESLLEKVKGQ